MNPIASVSVDVLLEPRGESPTPGVTGDADSAEFGLALAAAAQSQVAIVPQAAPNVAPNPVPTGVAGDTAADAAPTLVENVVDARGALLRPAPRALAPLPATDPGNAMRPVVSRPAQPTGAGPEGPPPASSASSQAKAAPLPLPARPAAMESEGPPLSALPSRPDPVRRPVPPAVPSASVPAPASPPAEAAATAARDASLRLTDLPLNIRVLELVRGMTEQAARVALDTALSAGPSQGVSPETAPPGRGWSVPWQSMEVPVVAVEASRQAQAARVIEALPGPGGLDASRPAARTPLRPASEAATPGEARTPDESWMARGAGVPRDAVPADPPMPAPRSDVRLPSEVPAQAVPVPVADERGRGRSGERTRADDGPTRAAGDMLADASVARASRADETVPWSAGPVPQNVRPSAGSVDPSAGSAQTTAVPQEVRTPARLGDQITLHFSGEDGLEGQLRVAVRGQNVRATILADDPVAAERFSRGIDSLQRALLDRGFADARLSVQQTARSEGAASGNLPRDGNQGDSQPRGDGRDRYSSSRQERESASPEDRPDRRSSRQRTER